MEGEKVRKKRTKEGGKKAVEDKDADCKINLKI
jgi:hypothetical protein